MAPDLSVPPNGTDPPSPSQPPSPDFITLQLPFQEPTSIQKRPRSEEVDDLQEDGTTALAPDSKRPKAQPLAKSGPDSVPFWGVQAIKPLTESNLERLQDSMSNSDQRDSTLSRINSPQHRRVSQLSSGKRSHSLMDPPSESPPPSRSCSAASLRFNEHLRDCCLEFEPEPTETPNADDVDTWRKVIAKKRDSPEPDTELFHLTRQLVKSKNEVSVVKRLSPMLFPYRDLPTNNQKTSNLVYIDDALWIEWGSIKPGSLPVPKPDLTFAFKRKAFSRAELQRMTSPYIFADSYAPSLTVEIKTTEQMAIAERQNANNIIPLLQRDYALQKANHMHRRLQRRIRFVSSAHDSAVQRYHAWYYVIDESGLPKWCFYLLSRIDFDDAAGDGYQKARQCNLNICEYISDTVFKQLRNTLAGRAPDDDGTGTQADVHRDQGSGEGDIGLSDIRSTSSALDSDNKRLKR